MMRAQPSIIRRAARRAFTLIEVLMALSAGVLVSLAAFLLSKNATLLFQHEARISAAQLALTVGLNRLTADIQRASFLSSMNPRVDPRVCKDPSWGVGMNSLTGVSIAQSVSPNPQSTSAANNLHPEQIWISGSLDSDEVYQVQSVQVGAGGQPLLVLRSAQTEPATLRALASKPAGVTLQNWLQCNFFMPPAPCTTTAGRYAHVYDPIRDYHYYGQIQALTVDMNNNVSVQLGNTIAVPLKANTFCGVASYNTPGVRWLLSVVSRVTYDVRSIVAAPPPAYQNLVSANLATPQGTQNMAAVTGDNGRTELVRVECDPVTGAEVANTLEVVSEYAVDLRFGITSQTAITQGNTFVPTMTTIPITTPANAAIYGTAPESIRSVQVRLATRSRAPDRVSPMPAAPTTDGRLLHFQIDPALVPQYARVRTAYANVTLPNQGGFWQW
jgi:prepilin-type N-terminal cleavage/methylation domain-containing protein